MKIWNKNFFLLWQGQLVSVFGDALYSLALGFWILEKTGSTAIMGTLMAFVSIPRIILGPLAGVIVDRSDRKQLIILSDIIRGVGICLIGIAAVNNVLEVWMVLLMGLILGACSSFFNPAMQSVFPDIVPKESLIKATSTYQMATSGADIIGQSIGGFLYGIIGAPLMFLLNGFSYLFSAGTESFITVPKVERKTTKVTFFEDFKLGIKFILTQEGLVRTIIMAFFINFLFGMIRVLIIPWFLSNPSLGMTRYGILGGFQSLGLILGTLLLSFITIKSEHKYFVYVGGLLSFVALIFIGTLSNQFFIILFAFMAAFSFQFIFNTIANSTIMLVTPVHMRGKVIATISTLAMSISPFGNLVGGVLGDVLNPRHVILISAAVAFVLAYFMIVNKQVKTFLTSTCDEE